MLVLGRRKGETIKIGRDVEVTVLAVRGDRVRLGIVAPREVPVLRAEIVSIVESDEERTGEAA